MRSRVLATTLVLLPLLAGGTSAGSSADDVRLTLQAGSRIWIEGDSNLHRWHCEVGSFDAQLDLDRAGPATPPTRLLTAAVSLPVSGIECGNGKMNDNLRKAIDARANPQIRFDLTSAQLVDPGVPGPGGVEALVTGRLAVAGATRELTMHVSGTDTGHGSLRMQGSARILMSDWGIEPPTAMLGLLKTADEVTIFIDLTAAYLDGAGPETP
jgi:polyisoprenoid-binding protein YceI